MLKQQIYINWEQISKDTKDISLLETSNKNWFNIIFFKFLNFNKPMNTNCYYKGAIELLELSKKEIIEDWEWV
jgi:hypothetical protein